MNPADLAGSRQFLAFRPVLDRLAPLAGEMAAMVAADLPGPRAVEEIEPIVARLLAGLSSGSRLAGGELARLRGEGAAAARAGRPLQAPIDEYLTATWVLWERARAVADRSDDVALAGLAAALLRAGDDIAAALADGYTGAERVLAARAGATRRAVLDELLTLEPEPAALARLARRVQLVGLDPGRSYALVLVVTDTEMEDEGALAQAVARRLSAGRGDTPHLVAARDGALVMLTAGQRVDAIGAAFGDLGGDSAWWAVAAEAAPIDRLRGAYVDARDALRVVRALDLRGRVVPVPEVALERALVGAPEQARAAVEQWLGPLERVRGGEALLATLETHFAADASVAETARRLAVAPRTVSYRLARIAALVGRDIHGDVRLRLAAALLMRRLLMSLGEAR